MLYFTTILILSSHIRRHPKFLILSAFPIKMYFSSPHVSYWIHASNMKLSVDLIILTRGKGKNLQNPQYSSFNFNPPNKTRNATCPAHHNNPDFISIAMSEEVISYVVHYSHFHKHITISNVAIEWLAFLFRVWEAPSSNLGPDTGYPDFSCFPQFLQVNAGCLKSGRDHFLSHFSNS
jgi:hypothetical protein